MDARNSNPPSHKSHSSKGLVDFYGTIQDQNYAKVGRHGAEILNREPNDLDVDFEVETI